MSSVRFTQVKGQCSDCNRGTHALFLHNAFLSWRRCSRCWTPTEKGLVHLKSRFHATASDNSDPSPQSGFEDYLPHKSKQTAWMGSRGTFVSLYGRYADDPEHADHATSPGRLH
jgi:hypothetical protein